MDIFAFFFSLFFVLFCSFLLFFIFRTLKAVTIILDICCDFNRNIKFNLNNLIDNERSFFLSGKLEQNEVIYKIFKYHFKFLFSKKGWKKYENNWNSEHQF